MEQSTVGETGHLLQEAADLPAISRRSDEQPQCSAPEGSLASQMLLHLFYREAAGWETPAVRGRRAPSVEALRDTTKCQTSRFHALMLCQVPLYPARMT